jgi:hypothetical protein
LGQSIEPDRATPSAIDATLARAVPFVANGDATAAAQVVAATLAAAPSGHAGWLIPIEHSFMSSATAARGRPSSRGSGRGHRGPVHLQADEGSG